MSAVPFKVKAIYEYASPHDDDLSFPSGQIISVTQEEDDDWYAGEYVDSAGNKHEGIFPRNFVEKYEPEIPSRPTRPTRTKKDTEVQQSALPVITQGTSTQAIAATGEREALPERPIGVSSPPSGALASPPPSKPSAHQPFSSNASKSAEQAQTTPVHQDVPTQMSEKPAGGSFKDRIAAFNKPAAPPVAPFKPGGQGTSTGFIKKPFVAPPPSKNAYVPPPREAPPTKAYRREGDLEVNETAEDSEASMSLLPEKTEAAVENQPKPTSLKDRIALLQKQQLEQAARLAEAAQKKEKPKRPTRKRTESHEPFEASEAAAEAGTGDHDASGTIGKKSVELADDESEPLEGRGGRQPSSVAHMATPPVPSRELMSDTNDADYSAAGDTEEGYDTSTSREDNAARNRRAQTIPSHKELISEADEAERSDEQLEEDQNVDPEIKRRMEIRERMAKMSGGMGLMGIFGPAGGMPTPGKKATISGNGEKDVTETDGQFEDVERARPVPVPGMSNIKSPVDTATEAEEDPSSDEGVRQVPRHQTGAEAEQTDEDIVEPPRPPPRTLTERGPPPAPPGRAVPSSPQLESRTPPPIMPGERVVPAEPSSPPQGRPVPPPPRASIPLSAGELSDDEMSYGGGPLSSNRVAEERSRQDDRDVPSPHTAFSAATTGPTREASVRSQASPTSPSTHEKRISRGVPPLPPSSPPISHAQQFRTPPPPPPGQPPTRKSTSQYLNMPPPTEQQADASEGEVTEYDGDYDTDIAPSAKHKDALKSSARDSSLEENRMVDQTASKGRANSPGRGPPPLPNVSAPRDIPPLPQFNQTAKHPRKSTDVPRAAPPPIPPSQETFQEEAENEYDPYKYHAPQQDGRSPTSHKAFSPILQPPEMGAEDEDLYEESPRSAHAPPPPPAHGQPPSTLIQPHQASQNALRQSLDTPRSQATSRRSMEVPRPSGEQGFMASDVDLAPSSQWYAQTPDVPPPSLQKRNDILCEIESSTSSKRGGKTTVSKDIYILYMDYSQTVITASFGASDPTNVTFEQRHERPPSPPRQDQLEAASNQFGSRIASSVPSKANSTIGDGTSHALILDLLHPLSTSALLPVGTRAYGALVYANLANASTQQFDEIRPGDIVTFRNAKFAGHKGGLHTKYSMDVGKPDHVAVVADWDGTKKKIRVWEQKGKEGGKGPAKVKEEGYRVTDLKSGEVRVWRVMGRGWVGWEGGQK